MRVYVLVAALPGWLTTVVAAPAATRGLIGTAAIARMVIAGDISATATFSPAPIAVERFSCCICLNRAVSNERELHRFPTKNPKLNPIEVTGCVGATLSGCVPCPRSFGDISSLAMPRIDLKNDEIDFESIEYPSTEDITWPVTTDGKCGPKWGRICGDSAFGSCCSSYGECGNSFGHCSALYGLGPPWSEYNMFYKREEGDISTTSNLTNAELDALVKPITHAKLAADHPISRDGTCGPNFGGKTCAGFSGGTCCSVFGYCGLSSDHCARGVCLGNPYGTCSYASLVLPANQHQPAERNRPPTFSHTPNPIITRFSYDPITTTRTWTYGDFTYDPFSVAKGDEVTERNIPPIITIKPDPITIRFSYDPYYDLSYDPYYDLSYNPLSLAKRKQATTEVVVTSTEYEAVTTATTFPTTTTVEVAYASQSSVTGSDAKLITLVNPLVPGQTVVRGVSDAAFPSSLAQAYEADSSYVSVDIKTFNATNLPNMPTLPTTNSTTTTTIWDNTGIPNLPASGAAEVTNDASSVSNVAVTSKFEEEQVENSGKALIGYGGRVRVVHAIMGMLACLGLALLL